MVRNAVLALISLVILAFAGFGVRSFYLGHEPRLVEATAQLERVSQERAQLVERLALQSAAVEQLKAAGEAQAARLRAAEKRANSRPAPLPLPPLPNDCDAAARVLADPATVSKVLEGWR